LIIFPLFPHLGCRPSPRTHGPFLFPNLGQLINYVFEYRAKEAVEKLTGEAVTAKH
jgi:hypothetical protein